MAGEGTMSSLKTLTMKSFQLVGLQSSIYLVCVWLEAEPGAVERGGLLGVADPPLDVVKLQKPAQKSY